MSRIGWKGISSSYTSQARPSKFPRSTPTYRCGLTLASNKIRRRPFLVATMAVQRPISAVATTQSEHGADCDVRYRPFLLDEKTRSTDWISELELDTASKMVEQNLGATGQPLRVLVLYGSLRKRYGIVWSDRAVRTLIYECRSYSKLMAFEASRILHRLGCDVRVFDPAQLPVKNDVDEKHEKVQELRELSRWSDGHVWCTPEQHGNLACLNSPLLACSNSC